MKRFKYSLENVLHYKEQILDSIKAEHGTLLAQIRKKRSRDTGTGEQAGICPE
ncbi:MAG: hypothetical protein ACLTBC_14420 [Pilosibacter sp.]